MQSTSSNFYTIISRTKDHILEKLHRGKFDKFIRVMDPESTTNQTIMKKRGLKFSECFKSDKKFLSECLDVLCDHATDENLSKFFRNNPDFLTECVEINEKFLQFFDKNIDENILFTLIEDRPILISYLSVSYKKDEKFMEKLLSFVSIEKLGWCRYYCLKDVEISSSTSMSGLDRFNNDNLSENYIYSKDQRFPVCTSYPIKNSEHNFDLVLFPV